MKAEYILKDNNFEIGLGEKCEVIYFSLKGEKQFTGGSSPEIVLYDIIEKKLVEAERSEYKPLIKDDYVQYHIDSFYGEKKVSFLLNFAFSEGVFTVEKKDVSESDVQLVTIDFTKIIETDSNGRLMLPAKGGRLVNPEDCQAGEHEHRYNWVDDSFPMYATIYNSKACALMKLNSLNDTIYSRITDDGCKQAALGVKIRHRYTFVDKPYRKVMGNDNKKDAAEKVYPFEESFLAKDNSKISIYMYEQKSEDLNTGWVFGAKKIYSFLPQKRTDFYKDRFVYKVFAGCLNQPIDISFKQILDLIKDIYDNTFGAKQICYIVGFQHDGHDSKYPDVFTVNKNAGSEKELIWLIEEAKRYNTTVSFHDNYDDAYEESPMWDPDDIGIDNKGHLLAGGCWNGRQAFWISLPYYSKTKSKQRIKKTLEKYPIDRTYHLDVLTASVFRLDFRKDEPSCKEKDLEGRLEVLRQFRDMGVDVSSEAVGAPFLGEISFFWHLVKRANPIHIGDKRIPAAPFYVHGKADCSGNLSGKADIIDALLYAVFYGDDLKANTPKKEIYDGYYLIQVPLNKIRNYEAVRYEEFNGYKTVYYENNSYVKVNYESFEIEVVVDGELIIRDGTLFIKKSKNEYIAYTAFIDGYEPKKFDLDDELSDNYKAKAYSVSKFEEEYVCEIKDGKLALMLPPGRPFIIKFEKESK